MKNNKKIIIGILVTSLVISAATFSYALWQKYFTQTGQNTTTTAQCFKINLVGGEDVTMLEAMPQEDKEGLKNTPYKITITNTCNTLLAYNVILNKKADSTLEDRYVKVATDGQIVLLSETDEVSTKDLENYTKENKSRIVGKGYIAGEATKTVEVATWIDNATTAAEGGNKIFNYKITVEATIANQDEVTLKDLILANGYHAEEPDFTQGFPNSSTSPEDKINLSGLYKTMDNDGITYYYRGKVTNNYVDFANKTWRILRINGDGTIRLILNTYLSEVGYVKFNSEEPDYQDGGYTYDNVSSCTNASPCISSYSLINQQFTMTPNGTSSIIKDILEQWYINNLNDYDSKIATTTFCNDVSYGSGTEDTRTVYYGSSERTKAGKPSLECPDPKRQDGNMRLYGGVYKLKIGLINADETIMGGYAIYGHLPYTNTENYLRRAAIYWTMSPSHIGCGFGNDYDGYLSGSRAISGGGYVDPVINLKADTIPSSGDGTSSSPFKIN